MVGSRSSDAELWWPRGHGDQPLYDLTVADPAGTTTARPLATGGSGSAPSRLRTEDDDDGHVVHASSSTSGRCSSRAPTGSRTTAFPHRVDRDAVRGAARPGRGGRHQPPAGLGRRHLRADDFYDRVRRARDPGLAGLPLRLRGLRGGGADALARSRPRPATTSTRLVSAPQPGAVERQQREHLGLLGLGLEGAARTAARRGAGLLLRPAARHRRRARPGPARTRPAAPTHRIADRHPNDPAHGTMHIWDVWNQRDYTAYRDYRPRFVSEFGWQGPPTWSTLTRAVRRRSADARVAGHARAPEGHRRQPQARRAASRRTFRSPTAWRTGTGRCAQPGPRRPLRRGALPFAAPALHGRVVWQLNDCWPVTSWAAVDGDGRRKPLWYALRARATPPGWSPCSRDGRCSRRRPVQRHRRSVVGPGGRDAPRLRRKGAARRTAGG